MRKRNDFATLVFTREAMGKFGLKKEARNGIRNLMPTPTNVMRPILKVIALQSFFKTIQPSSAIATICFALE